jgi:probable phosphoglycerate mutase
MPIILLIRHGENEYVKTGRLAGRLPGVHLNDKGRTQAQAVADKLAGSPVKAIYSSPLERTMETAEPIAKALGLEIIQRPGLIETDVGEWQGKKLKGLSRLKIWRVVQSRPSLMRFPGGETFAEAQYRISQELLTLSARHDPKDIFICVTHSDPIKLAVAYFIGQPLDLFQRLNVSPGSITALYLWEGSSVLITLNYDLSFNLPKE